MRFIAVFHVVCAVILAASAAPLSDRAVVAVDSREEKRAAASGIMRDTFNTVDLSSTPASSASNSEETIKPIVDEVDPEQPSGCVIA
ncbi:hypothetical protein GGX14DRAFT_470525 [Mycena pura]|uniref:Uncharacterized protein n=1 Tax=Mycena pura TaxID=153505 RepID=A0AAD6Y5M6_9AGAR|nr:hypothetical protein GGX14DRAFT_470525 [Mycena pura]